MFCVTCAAARASTKQPSCSPTPATYRYFAVRIDAVQSTDTSAGTVWTPREPRTWTPPAPVPRRPGADDAARVASLDPHAKPTVEHSAMPKKSSPPTRQARILAAIRAAGAAGATNAEIAAHLGDGTTADRVGIVAAQLRTAKLINTRKRGDRIAIHIAAEYTAQVLRTHAPCTDADCPFCRRPPEIPAPAASPLPPDLRAVIDSIGKRLQYLDPETTALRVAILRRLAPLLDPSIAEHLFAIADHLETAT